MNFKDEDDDNDEEENEHFHWATLVMIIFLFFSLLINLMIILIHSKQNSIRKGFFNIIFVQIFLEVIINLSLLIMNIIYFIGIEIGIWFIIFPILFNFGYVTNILYNIRILFYLMTLNKRKDELINYESNEEDNNKYDDDSKTSKRTNVDFISHSFKSFHIFCFLLSIIHTILYAINLFMHKNDIKNGKWKWFYYFMNGSKGIYRFAFFIFHFTFFFISLPYLFLSLNKEKISEHILLKRFSIYCIVSSIVGLLFPVSIILYLKFEEKQEDIYFIIMFAFILYLSFTWFFRVNCYYIQYILGGDGKGFCKKFYMGFKILFCCKSIPSPNFIDLNSSYIYHSLANLNDFLTESACSERRESDELL